MAPQGDGERVNRRSFWVCLATLDERDDARGEPSERTKSAAREPHLRAPLGESFG